MFSTAVKGGKPFGAEQKLSELKKKKNFKTQNPRKKSLK